MSKISTAKVKGASGEHYSFEVYPLDVMFSPGIAGVYLIARRYKNEEGNFILDPIYVGESSNLALICGYHPQQKCFAKYSPNCRCIYRAKDPERRQYIVEDLIEELEPRCN